MAIDIVPMTQDAVGPLSRDLRDNDVREIALASGETAYDALCRGCLGRSYTAWLDGRPLAAFGVYAGERGHGCPWFLGTYAIEDAPLEFAKRSKTFLPTMIAGFSYLENHVWAKYTAAVRWVRWLGFNVDSPEPHGPRGSLFHRFWMEV